MKDQNELWQRSLKAALEASQKAREILLGYMGKLKNIEEKAHAGLVSEADKKSEEFIQSYLSRVLPEFGFLGEESSFVDGQTQIQKPTQSGYWIVDPLDGTTNYIHQYPVFCISIGLMFENDLKVGVIDVPVLNETYWAIKGEGAFCNGQRMSVSKKSTLKDCLTSTGFFADHEETLQEQLRIFSEVVRRTRGVRRPGAAAYDMCQVARGVFDLFWERNLKPWDTAAGTLLVREAGGIVETYQGKPYDPYKNSMVASTVPILEEFKKLVGPHLLAGTD